MLEMLLMTYRDQFGEEFPLASFKGTAEIDVINILYSCLQNGRAYSPGDELPGTNRFPDAPGQK